MGEGLTCAEAAKRFCPLINGMCRTSLCMAWRSEEALPDNTRESVFFETDGLTEAELNEFIRSGAEPPRPVNVPKEWIWVPLEREEVTAVVDGTLSDLDGGWWDEPYDCAEARLLVHVAAMRGACTAFSPRCS